MTDNTKIGIVDLKWRENTSVDICQSEHKGGNINKSYMKLCKAKQVAISCQQRSLMASPFFLLAMRDL